MEYYNLYKLGCYGYFHITSEKFNNLSDAIKYYKKAFNIKLGNELFNYKVTGI